MSNLPMDTERNNGTTTPSNLPLVLSTYNRANHLPPQWERDKDCVEKQPNKEPKINEKQAFVGNLVLELCKCMETQRYHVVVQVSDIPESRKMYTIQEANARNKVLNDMNNFAMVDLEHYKIADAIKKLQAENVYTLFYQEIGIFYLNSSEHAVFRYSRLIDSTGVVKAEYKPNSLMYSSKNLKDNGKQISAIKPSGSREEYVEGIKKLVVGRPLLEIVLCASLAGLLNVLMEGRIELSLVLNIAGLSSHGKTLSTKFALSMFGNPATLFRSVNSTRRALDNLRQDYKFIPVTADDIAVSDDNNWKKVARAITQFLFETSTGYERGTARIGDKRQNGWYPAPILSSSEKPLAGYLSQSKIGEGQLGRFLELCLSDDDDGKLTDSRQHADEIELFCSRYYGTGILSVMEYILNMGNFKIQLNNIFEEELNNLMAAYEKKIQGKASGMECRVLKQAGLIATATEVRTRTQKCFNKMEI